MGERGFDQFDGRARRRRKKNEDYGRVERKCGLVFGEEIGRGWGGAEADGGEESGEGIGKE